MFPHTLCNRLSPQKLLVAAPDGRCWLTSIDIPKVIALPVSALAAKRSSLAASAVEGAIAAGLSQASHSPERVSYTLPRYVRWLAGNYAFAGQTPGLFRRAAKRFDAFLRRDLAKLALKKAQEEDGHANLAYRDLEDLGLPAGEVIRLIQPPSAAAFADRFETLVESSDPVALFGFSYCLERMAVERGDAFMQEVQSICPPKTRAIRFLKVHSNIGSDSAHVREQLSFFESITNAELEAVTSAAFETAAMLVQQPLMDQALTDLEICRRVACAGIKLPDTRIDQETNKGDLPRC